MRILLPLIITIILIILLDLYAFQAFRAGLTTASPWIRKSAYVVFWAFTILLLLTFAMRFAGWIEFIPKPVRVYLFAVLFLVYFSKFFIAIFAFIDDIQRGVRWLIALLQSSQEVAGPSKGISRSEFLNRIGLLAGSVPLMIGMYGMAANAYRYRKHFVELAFPDLPESFDGLKIVQISDIHSGSFTFKKPLYQAVAMINEEEPDLVFFTGDLVNSKAYEIEPYKEIFGQIKAKEGVYSIFGNHDYGDYAYWKSPEAKARNRQRLIRHHRDMGWDVLLNEHRIIQRGNDKIAIIGVENWSMKLRFPKYGDLKKALAGTESIPFKILLSHDPSHWRGEVLGNHPDIKLTLSGHTHGGQFGIELGNFRWSPVQYVYEEWAGLYQELSQYLYVNRGFGFLGYPGRVGILPEITVIRLKRA